MKLKTEDKYSLAILIAGWLITCTLAFLVLHRYSSTPGKRGLPPKSWPVTSRLSLSTSKPTLVMMVHPRCPCTRASLYELEALLTQVKGLVNTHIVFIRPRNVDADWEKSDIWQQAHALSGVDISIDEGGREAEIFHSYTSGQVMLYDKDGQLVFSGGITVSRGHVGESEGRRAITNALLSRIDSTVPDTAVYGCPLFNESLVKERKDWCDGRHQ